MPYRHLRPGKRRSRPGEGLLLSEHRAAPARGEAAALSADAWVMANSIGRR
ncbi:hypothetical protein [Streptomyces sp. NPDC055287]